MEINEMNVFEINAEILAAINAYEQGIEEAVNEETGEVVPLKDYIDKLECSKNEKINNVTLFVKNREAMIEAIKNQVKKLEERIKRETKRIADAENYIRMATEENNYEDREGRFAITFKKNPPSVQIQKGAVVPADYMRTKTTTEPDKKKLKAALQDGKKFDGISLVQAINMIIK